MAQAKSGCGKILPAERGDIELTKAFRKNIAMYAPNTGVAKKNWQENNDYDAWLVFNIWGISNRQYWSNHSDRTSTGRFTVIRVLH